MVARRPRYCPDQASARARAAMVVGVCNGARAVKIMMREIAVSRRSMLRVLASAASACALEGCSSLAGPGARIDAAELTANPTLLIATTRKPINNARAKPWFGTERAARMSIARAKLVAPSDGRFSLASIGLDDWRLETIETAAAGRRRHARRAALRARLQPDVRDRGARRRAPLQRHRLPRRDHGVFLAVQGEAVRLRLRPRERHVVARRAGAGALRADHEPGGRAGAYRRAQRRHHVDAGGHSPDLRSARRHGRRADRHRGVRLARYRHGRVLLLGPAHWSAGIEDHRHHLDQ